MDNLVSTVVPFFGAVGLNVGEEHFVCPRRRGGGGSGSSLHSSWCPVQLGHHSVAVFNMTSAAWSEKMVKLLSRMNNFYSAGRPVSCQQMGQHGGGGRVWQWPPPLCVSTGSSRVSCCRFEIDTAQVGWIPPYVAALLTRYPDVFNPPHGGAVTLCHSLDSYGRRSEAVDAVLKSLRHEASLSCLRGWRDEVARARTHTHTHTQKLLMTPITITITLYIEHFSTQSG